MRTAKFVCDGCGPVDADHPWVKLCMICNKYTHGPTGGRIHHKVRSYSNFSTKEIKQNIVYERY